MASAMDGVEIGMRKAFDNAGSSEGRPSPIPSRERTGAFMDDEATNEYKGEWHDAAGPRGTPAGGRNEVPRAGLRNEGPV